MNHVAYVEWYTDFDPNDGAEFEEFDHHLKVYSGRMYADGYCGLLDLELDNNGIPEGWVDELKKYPSGFYELHYDSYTDHEYCDGYIAYSYEVACEILSMKKSWKAWVYYLLDEKIYPKLDFLCSLFLPHWRIDFEYGGAGLCKTKLFLPKALWIRFIRPKHYAKNMWGENYTKLSLYRGW